MGEHPVAFGGFSDIWKAEDANGEVFAIKMLRVYRNNVERVKKVGRCARFLTYCQKISDWQPTEILEILQRSYHIEADEPPKRPADRGCGPRSIPMLHGVQVDGERECVRVLESVSRAHRPVGAGEE